MTDTIIEHTEKTGEDARAELEEFRKEHANQIVFGVDKETKEVFGLTLEALNELLDAEYNAGIDAGFERAREQIGTIIEKVTNAVEVEDFTPTGAYL